MNVSVVVPADHSLILHTDGLNVTFILSSPETSLSPSSPPHLCAIWGYVVMQTAPTTAART